MTEHVALRRSEGLAALQDSPPGWRPATDFGGALTYGDGRTCAVVVSCPAGHLLQLPHRIAADGTVTPSVVCPTCGWHVFARLLGWSP